MSYVKGTTCIRIDLFWSTRGNKFKRTEIFRNSYNSFEWAGVCGVVDES